MKPSLASWSCARLARLAALWSLACATTACIGLGTRGESGQLGPDRLAQLADGIFEVVIPRREEPTVVYAEGRTLPTSELPFMERTDKYFSVGTAFAIAGDRLVSAAHVFQLDVFALDREFFVRDRSGKVYPVDKVLQLSQYRDLVVFTVRDHAEPLPALELRTESQVGERVYTVGDAFGEGIAARDGQIASYTFEPVAGAWKDIRFSAAASPGNSGGPLLNSLGQVLGVVVRKNESENLNVATPVAELARLPASSAEFFVASIEANADGEPLRDWRFAAPLPASLTALGAAAEADRRQFHLSQWRATLRAKQDRLFPKDPALVEYAGRQSYSPLIQTLTGTAKEGYRLAPDEPQYERTTEGGVMVSAMQDQADYALASIELPPGADIGLYLREPARLLDAIFDVYGFVRDFNGRKLPLKSFGPPAAVSTFTDMLGRPWLKAVWRTWYNEGTLLLNCLPAPTGFGCVLDDIATSEETYGLQEKFEEYNAGMLAMSYRGSLAEWRAFLGLGTEVLPRVLRGVTVGAEHGKLAFAGGAFRLAYPQPLATSASALFVGVGYGVNELLTPEIQSLRFDHGPDLAVSEQFDLEVEPPPGSDGPGGSRWAAASVGGDDRNAALAGGGAGWVHHLLDERALKDGRKVAVTVDCRGPGKRPPPSVVATCERIKRSVKAGGLGR